MPNVSKNYRTVNLQFYRTLELAKCSSVVLQRGSTIRECHSPGVGRIGPSAPKRLSVVSSLLAVAAPRPSGQTARNRP